jgi:hypothetical protein
MPGLLAVMLPLTLLVLLVSEYCVQGRAKPVIFLRLFPLFMSGCALLMLVLTLVVWVLDLWNLPVHSIGPDPFRWWIGIGAATCGLGAGSALLYHLFRRRWYPSLMVLLPLVGIAPILALFSKSDLALLGMTILPDFYPTAQGLGVALIVIAAFFLGVAACAKPGESRTIVIFAAALFVMTICSWVWIPVFFSAHHMCLNFQFEKLQRIAEVAIAILFIISWIVILRVQRARRRKLKDEVVTGP